MTDTADEKQRLKARELNELIRYTMWAVFTVTDRDALAAGRGDAATELTDLLDQAKGKGIVTRGCYDLQGMRADADYMLWWVAPTSDELQDSTRATSRPSWPGRSPRTTSASTPSSGTTSGT